MANFECFSLRCGRGTPISISQNGQVLSTGGSYVSNGPLVGPSREPASRNSFFADSSTWSTVIFKPVGYNPSSEPRLFPGVSSRLGDCGFDGDGCTLVETT